MASEIKSIAIAMLMRDIGSVDFFMRANLHNIHDNAKKYRRKFIKKKRVCHKYHAKSINKARITSVIRAYHLILPGA